MRELSGVLTIIIMVEIMYMHQKVSQGEIKLIIIGKSTLVQVKYVEWWVLANLS